MRMNLLGTALLLLASMVAVAQQDQQPSASPSGQQSTTGVGGSTDKNEPLFSGCLSGTKDNYMLKDENGETYRLHSDKDLDDHVGNMVEIRGTVKKEGDDRSEAAAGSRAEKEIDVADVKTVSSGCDKKSDSGTKY